MINQTSEDYGNYLDLDLAEKLKPVSQTIDEMLTRLEEFEAMVAMVQQERCNSIGITGALSQTVDHRRDLKELCRRVDALETVVEHVKSNITTLENKIEMAEKHFGVVDNTTKLKSFLSPFFKKTLDSNVSSGNAEMEIFSTEKYFSDSQEEATAD